MAIWQWDVWLVPRQAVVERFSIIPSHLDLDWFESTDWWVGASEDNLVSFFNTILPACDPPWAKNTTSWGTDDGDEIMLATANGGITSVSIRIDLRHLAANFLGSLINFARGNDFLFYAPESKRFISPTMEDISNEIRNSRKAAFLRNPTAFFEDDEYLEKINKENQQKLKNQKKNPGQL